MHQTFRHRSLPPVPPRVVEIPMSAQIPFGLSAARLSGVAAVALTLLVVTSSDALAQRRGGGGSARPEPVLSPADRIKAQVESNDPFDFLNDQRKQLSLSDAQRDSFKVYQKELKKSRDPLIKEVYKHMPRGNADGGMPDTVRALTAALRELNTSWEERAFSHLDAAQRARADTLRIQWMIDQRANRGRP